MKFIYDFFGEPKQEHFGEEKEKSKKNHKLLLIAFFIIIFAAILVRFDDLTVSATHTDDLIVPYRMLFLPPPVQGDIDAIAANNTEFVYGSRAFHFFVFMNDLGKFNQSVSAIKTLLPYVHLPLKTTYAPLQYVLTAPFMVHANSYYGRLLVGRLPATISSILTLFALLVFFYQVTGEKFSLPALLGATFLAFSWESIIFAKNTSPYSLGMFIAAILICLIVYFVKKDTLTRKEALVLGCGLGVAAYGHYMIIPLLFLFYATTCCYFIARKKPQEMKRLILSGVIFLVVGLIAIVLLLRVSTAGVAGKTGGDQEFIFSPVGSDGSFSVISFLSYSAEFFIKNSFLTYLSQTAFLPENNVGAPVFASIFYIFFFVGIVSLYQKKDRVSRGLFLYIMFVILAYLGLVVLKKLTLGPSRHYIFHLPMMVIGTVLGIEYIVNRIVAYFAKNEMLKSRTKTLIYFCLILVVCIAFFSSYGAEREARKSHFYEGELKAYFDAYEVDAVFQTATENTVLMPSIQSNFAIFNQGWMNPQLVKEGKIKTIAYIDHRFDLDACSFGNMVYQINSYPFSSLRVNPHRENYQVIFQKVVLPEAESIEYSSRVGLGGNGLYLYILQTNETEEQSEWFDGVTKDMRDCSLPYS